MGQTEDPVYSNAVVVAELATIQMPVSTHLGYDAFWRLFYEKADKALQKQANELLLRGNLTADEARQLVEQRNRLVIEFRKPLSPFGRFYSEALKPGSALPTLNTLVEKKKTIEAVVTSVGKTRAATNRFAFFWRRAGPAGVIIEVVATAVVIQKAPESERRRVATTQVAGSVTAFGAGRVGMWGGAVAGAAWAGTWASPSLIIPIVGEFTTGGAIILGGIVGGLLASWAGHEAGTALANEIWEHLPVSWTQ
jgi:hypothetical protein